MTADRNESKILTKKLGIFSFAMHDLFCIINVFFV